MDRIKRFIFGSKQQAKQNESIGQTVKNTKMTIEETIRRYEQLAAKQQVEHSVFYFCKEMI